MRTVKDQFGRTIDIPEHPERIISLVPSQTEFLADLGLDDRVVGITRFCERPADWFYKKARVGGTKDPDTSRIAGLKPDLILGNAEENTKKSIHELEVQYPVWISDVSTLDEALEMMLEIGRLTYREDTARDWVHRIQKRFEEYNSPSKKLRVLYLIWKNPWMAAGRANFINDMLVKAGFENVISDPESRYPSLTSSDIIDLNPDVIFLSSEPFPFNDKHVDEVQKEFKSNALIVDGAAFSWYGTRLLHSPSHFEEIKAKLGL